MTPSLLFMFFYFMLTLVFMLKYIKLKNDTEYVLRKEYIVKMKIYDENYELMSFLLSAKADDIVTFRAIYSEFYHTEYHKNRL